LLFFPYDNEKETQMIATHQKQLNTVEHPLT